VADVVLESLTQPIKDAKAAADRLSREVSQIGLESLK
jgi:hypothetical protein